MRTSIAREDYVAMTAASGRSTTVLEQMPGWRLERTRNDDMHCSKLGIGPLVIANTVITLAYRRFYLFMDPAVEQALPADAPVQDVLDDLGFRFKEWCKDHKLQVSIKRFTLSRLNRSSLEDFPNYSRCKASWCVPLVAWLATLTLEYAERCPIHLKEEGYLMANCVWEFTQYFYLCKCAGRFLTEL